MNPLSFGRTYVVGDTITVAHAKLGNSGGTDVVLTVSSITYADQVKLDYGTVT